jgi:hypothetical protein
LTCDFCILLIVKISFRIRILAGIFLLFLTGYHLPGKGGDPGNGEIQSDSAFYFKGRVLESIYRQPVAFTHIINTGRNTATICDTMGYFYITVSLSDTLKFTAIGYAPENIVITDSIRRLSRLPDIMLQSISYSIQGVMINPLGSYQNFRHNLIALELPPSKYEINPTVLTEIDKGTDTLDMVQAPGLSPITALYNWLSKEGKSHRKLAQLLEQEQFEKDIHYKYSPIIVSGITGYVDFELYRFMDFCSFKKKFLMEADRYEMRDAILNKQWIFEALQEE